MKHETAIQDLVALIHLKTQQSHERLAAGGDTAEKQDNFEIASRLQDEITSLGESIRLLREDQ